MVCKRPQVHKPLLEQLAASLMQRIAVFDARDRLCLQGQRRVLRALTPKSDWALQSDCCFGRSALGESCATNLNVATNGEFSITGLNASGPFALGVAPGQRTRDTRAVQEALSDGDGVVEKRQDLLLGIRPQRGQCQTHQHQRSRQHDRSHASHDLNKPEKDLAAPKRLKRIGSTRSVKRVEVRIPPVTTMARGR